MPPIVRTPVRDKGDELEATWRVITLFPIPLVVPSVTQDTLLCAFQAQAVDVVNVMPLTPPAALNERPVDGKSYEQVATGSTRELDSPPPGPGVNTVMLAPTGAARSSAGITADSLTRLVMVVARSEPFQRSTEAALKFVPVTVKVIPLLPTAATEGSSRARLGMGRVAVMVNVKLVEFAARASERMRLVAPGVLTDTWAVPGEVRSDAGIVARS